MKKLLESDFWLFKIIFNKNFYLPIVYIIGGLILYGIISSLLNKTLKIKKKNINTKKEKTIINLIRSILKFIITAIVLIMILDLYGINTTSLIASLGIAGVIAGLAFQDTIKNLLSGISIIFDDHYNVGDFVKINEFSGEVISLGLQSTKIKAFTGEIYVIGNSQINNVINYSVCDANLIMDLAVSYETDINKLESILTKLSARVEKIEDVIGPLSLLGIEDLADSAVKYRISIPCHAMTHAKVKREVLKIVKEEFDKNKISIPFNQLDININKWYSLELLFLRIIYLGDIIWEIYLKKIKLY